MRNTKTKDTENTPQSLWELKNCFLRELLALISRPSFNAFDVVNLFEKYNNFYGLQFTKTNGKPLEFRRVKLNGNKIRLVFQRVSGTLTEMTINKMLSKLSGYWVIEEIPKNIHTKKSKRIKLSFTND